LRKVTWSAGIFLWKIGSFHHLARRLLISVMSTPQLASFFTKMLIAATTAVTLLVFAVLIAILLALAVSLEAVLMTLIGRGSVDE
jgi:hypothetical protein